MRFIEFDGEYKKHFYDVCTADGEIIKHCWPNAGKIVAMDGSGRMWGPEDGIKICPSEDHPLDTHNAGIQPSERSEDRLE